MGEEASLFALFTYALGPFSLMVEFGSFFKIFDVRRDPDALRKLLQNKNGRVELPAQRLSNILQSVGCRSVVQEDSYIDADFRASHSRFYHLHYRDTPRRCQRLHFFKDLVVANDLDVMPETVGSTYLGFSVVRPLPAHRIGRTIVSQQVVSDMFPRLYRNEDRILTCKALYSANLAGNDLVINGTASLQQDKLVSACASASIWTANWHMCHRFPKDFHRFTTPQITDFAVRYTMPTGRAMPSDGLRAEQMLSALKAMGFEPIVRDPSTAEEAVRWAYNYVESGIPVIAIISFLKSKTSDQIIDSHAVTLVGHTYDMSAGQGSETSAGKSGDAIIMRDSDFVPRFLIQDDSGGLLRFMEFIDWDKAVDQGELTKEAAERLRDHFGCFVRIDDRVANFKDIAVLDGFLVPLPLRVTLDGHVAEKNAIELVQQLLLRPGKLSVKRLVFRTFLQPSNDYKRWWTPIEGRPLELVPEIRRHSFPHWIWVTEFADMDELQTREVVLGHVIQDSSGRGTMAFWDDVVAFIAPDRLTLSFPDGMSKSSTRPRGANRIARFRM